MNRASMRARDYRMREIFLLPLCKKISCRAAAERLGDESNASNRKDGTAAARGRGFGGVDLERLPDEIVDEIDFRALDEVERDGVDEHDDSPLFDRDIVVGALAVDV